VTTALPQITDYRRRKLQACRSSVRHPNGHSITCTADQNQSVVLAKDARRSFLFNLSPPLPPLRLGHSRAFCYHYPSRWYSSRRTDQKRVPTPADIYNEQRQAPRNGPSSRPRRPAERYGRRAPGQATCAGNLPKRSGPAARDSCWQSFGSRQDRRR
jgi:hypothetical protein